MSTVQRRVLVVTGTRAEFGLLRSPMRAIARHPRLALLTAVTGTHLLGTECTSDEVGLSFPVSAEFPMQIEAESGRLADARAFGRGVMGCVDTLHRLQPDVVVVLGDRIEAFAAASAAAIAGVRVAHMHGGDRAEGIADESMRHAISKLAHLHFPATRSSAERLERMGEDPSRIHMVGSPAIDELASMAPLDEAAFQRLGSPEIVFLLHPTGGTDHEEEERADRVIAACAAAGRTLALEPNRDAGREGILQAIVSRGVACLRHLPREAWVGLLRRTRLLVGNSSAGLIEAAALRVRVVDIGTRQAGRERPSNVVHSSSDDSTALAAAIQAALGKPDPSGEHPYGDGRAGERLAEVLASDAVASTSIAKRNWY